MVIQMGTPGQDVSVVGGYVNAESRFQRVTRVGWEEEAGFPDASKGCAPCTLPVFPGALLDLRRAPAPCGRERNTYCPPTHPVAS